MRLKLFLRYPVDIRRARRLLEGRSDPAPHYPARPLVLDLRTPQLMFDCGRHFQSLAFYASQTGSPTYVRCGHLLLGGISRKQFGGEMLAQPYVDHLPSDHAIPDQALVLGDYEPSELDRNQFAAGTTYLRMLIGRDIDRSIPVMPYPMHPATLRTLAQCDLEEMRRHQDGRNAILFAGSQKARYGDSWMLREFGILSRLEVIDTLKAAYPSRIESTMGVDSQ